MKFGAKYEILHALTRGDVETFAVRDRATGEKALAHIFECPEPPLDQPTVQWVLTSFRQLAPETPGTVIDVGRYDVVSFAYIVTRWPPDEAVDDWVREYHNKIGMRPTGDAPDSDSSQPAGQQAAAPDLQPEQPAAVDDPPSAESESQVTSRAPGEFTRQFFGGMAFPAEHFSGKDRALDAEQRGVLEGQTIVTDKDRSGSDISKSIGGASSPLVREAPEKPAPGQGEFTQQFFREINVPADLTPAPSAGTFTSAEDHEIDVESAKQPDSLISPWDRPPIPTSTALDLHNRPLAPDSQSGQFTKLFAQDLGSAIPPPVQDGAPSQEPPKPASGEFTKLFRVPPAAEESKSTTNDRFASESRSSTFARVFGPYVPDAQRNVGSATGNEREVMSTQDSSTGIFNAGNFSDHRSAEDSYTAGKMPPAANVDESGATQVFGERREYPKYSDRAFSHEPLTNPVISSQAPLPDSSQFNADSSGSATVLFRPPQEVSAESEPGLPSGPSEYTMIVNREALSASLSDSPDASPSSGASKAGGAAAAAAAVASPFVTPPAVPSYQVSTPQVPGYPAGPIVPGGAPPAMPAVAPPAVAALSVSAPAGQPSAGPKSYWPLIIILNVLFILAVLLILYFALKH